MPRPKDPNAGASKPVEKPLTAAVVLADLPDEVKPLDTAIPAPPIPAESMTDPNDSIPVSPAESVVIDLSDSYARRRAKERGEINSVSGTDRATLADSYLATADASGFMEAAQQRTKKAKHKHLKWCAEAERIKKARPNISLRNLAGRVQRSLQLDEKEETIRKVLSINKS